MSHFNTVKFVILFGILSLIGEMANAQSVLVLPRGLEKKGGTHTAVLRNQELQVDFSSLKGDLNLLKGKKKSIRLKPFANLTVDADVELKNVVNSSRGTFVGKTKAGGDIMISRSNDAFVINIDIGNHHIEIKPKEGGKYIVEEIDPSKFPEMGNDTDHADRAGDAMDSSAGAPDTGVVVDVLVIYASDTFNALGGIEGATAFADQAAENANLALANSLISARYRIAAVVQSATASSGNIQTDHNRLKSPTDGYFDEYLAAREKYGADLVSLFTEIGGYAGYGTLSPGIFTTVARSAAISNKTFAHELGHNMGCSHDAANATSPATPYAYGWRFVGLDGIEYRTVMAYSPGRRISYFSSPLINYQGVPTGTATADNSRRIREYIPTASNYRKSVIPTVIAAPTNLIVK